MRILLVEDHPQLAESVVQALKGAGWTVDLLQDGVAADLALASEEYALAILDVGLPRMDGFEVLARLRGRGKTLPVLMLTARGEVKDRVHGLNLGADDYLAKPSNCPSWRRGSRPCCAAACSVANSCSAAAPWSTTSAPGASASTSSR